ncbi:hypothetical protein Lal_00037870 [Lupinus albus]|nr:hypothetical protein Lal_00037870 [Lupinus albus]
MKLFIYILIYYISDEQCKIFKTIMEAVNQEHGRMFFLYGYGGTGKTHIVSISRMEKILKLEAVSVELEKLSRTKPNTHRGVDLRKGKYVLKPGLLTHENRDKQVPITEMSGRGRGRGSGQNDLLAQIAAVMMNMNENLQHLNQNATPSPSSQPLVPPGPAEYRGLDEFCRRNPSQFQGGFAPDATIEWVQGLERIFRAVNT